MQLSIILTYQNNLRTLKILIKKKIQILIVLLNTL